MLAVDLFDEAADHHLRRIEVGDNAVPQRPHGADAGVGAVVHQLGFLPYGDAFVIVVDCNYARLVQHNLVVLVDDGVGSSEVDCQLLIQKRK